MVKRGLLEYMCRIYGLSRACIQSLVFSVADYRWYQMSTTGNHHLDPLSTAQVAQRATRGLWMGSSTLNAFLPLRPVLYRMSSTRESTHCHPTTLHFAVSIYIWTAKRGETSQGN